LTRGKIVLEWIIGLLKALVKGRYTGGVNIRFKDGGISSVTKPKEKKDGLKKKEKELTFP